MRRTTIRLAIVALLFSSPAWAQEMVPGPPMGPIPSPESATGLNAVLPGPANGSLQPAVQPAPEAQWQPMETIEPMPDVTTSNTMAQMAGMPMVASPNMEARPHGPCCEQTGRGYCCPPVWYVDQRARVMHHPKPRGTITGQFGGTGQAYDGTEFIEVFTLRDGMSTRSMPFEPALGYELTIGHYLGRDAQNSDQFVEFTYYGLNKWDSSYAIHATQEVALTNGDIWPHQDRISTSQRVTFGNLYSLFDNNLEGFNRADDLEERYTSRFDNFELNLRIRPRARHDQMVLYQNGRWRRETQTGCSHSFLLGLRGISLDETYSLNGKGQVLLEDYSSGSLVTTTTNTSGVYNIRTHNDLVGLQIGGDVLWHKDFLELGVRMKAGAFINFADQSSTVLSTGGKGDPMADQTLYDANDQYYEERAARGRDVGGVAEFGFTAGYQLRRNMVVRASYDLMWLSGLALAPEQNNGQIGAPSRLNRNGLLMFQSLSLGLELDW